MSTNAHTSVQFGGLVTGAFDWAAQCHSDPRKVSFLAAKAVKYFLLRAGKESAFSHVSGFLRWGGFGPLLACGAAGGQPGPSTSNEGDVGR